MIDEENDPSNTDSNPRERSLYSKYNACYAYGYSMLLGLGSFQYGDLLLIHRLLHGSHRFC